MAASPARASKRFEEPELNATVKILTALGGRILKMSRTQPGSGFHYHGLEVMGKNANYTPVANLLKERTGAGVTCVDASMLHKIGCRPHTLTAMASGRRCVSALG
jgi:hypothetical protein